MCSLLREMNVKYQHVDDRRMEGLRALARMIAAAHLRRLRDSETGREKDDSFAESYEQKLARGERMQTSDHK